MIAVFLEDSAALAGIVFAVTGVTLSHVLHDPKWDGVAAVLIGLTLCSVAALLAAETRKLLIGEAADDQTVNRIWKALAGQPEVEHVERPLTMHFGPEEVLVNLEVKFKPEISGKTARPRDRRDGEDGARARATGEAGVRRGAGAAVTQARGPAFPSRPSM